MKKSVLKNLLITLLISLFAVPAGAATVNVVMQNSSFQPPSVTVNVGDTVTWTNNDSSGYNDIRHTTTSGPGCTPDGLWNSGPLFVGQSFSVVFNTPGTFPYHCSFHCSMGMVGTVTVNSQVSIMPLPAAPFVTTFQALDLPLLSADAAQAKPLGLGNVASGGDTLSLDIGLPQFSEAADVYFLLYLPIIDPNTIFQLTSFMTLQPISAGLAPLIPNTTGPVSVKPLGDISVSPLPFGQYVFGVLVTPAGDASLTRFDLWVTSVTMGGMRE